MTLLTLTGWAQRKDALEMVVPQAHALEYLAYESEEEWWQEMHAPIRCDLAVGWSLGGLVLAHAIAEQKIIAQKMVLIAAPFRFLQNKHFQSATSLEQWSEFTRGFKKDPVATLTRFDSVMLYGDAHYKTLREDVPARCAMSEKEQACLTYWLTYLGKQSAETMEMSHFPPTLLIHGEEDAVVPLDQATYWQRALPQSDIVVVPSCGHAPHWHAPEAVAELIRRVLRHE